MSRRPTPSRSRKLPKPNPKRMALLAGIAVVAMGVGYGLASMFAPTPEAPEPARQSAPQPAKAWYQDQAPPPELVRGPDAPILSDAYPEDRPGDARPVYEEALPEEIHSPTARLTDSPASIQGGGGQGVMDEGGGGPQGLVAPAEMTSGMAGGTASEATIPNTNEMASLPPVPDTITGQTLLQKNALAQPGIGDDVRPKIAIVIDDMGVDRRHSNKIVELPGPLTLAYLTYAPDLPEQTARARGAGHELMMHVAMQPLSDTVDPGPHVLLTEHSADEIRERLAGILDKLSGYVGINNHMGSKFTADALGMAVVMEQLRLRGLMFLDSRTAPESVGREMAERYAVPVLERNVFLDNVGEVEAILARLAETERFAEKHGHAIAIGHPRRATLDALAKWLPGLQEKGFRLVPISALLQPAPVTADRNGDKGVRP